MLRGLCTLVAVAFAIGCGGREPYRCTSSDQCVGNGATGVCESSGFCSFVDPACPGGRKYEDGAGNGLGGTCVTFDAGSDAPVASSCIADVAYGRHFGCVLRDDNTVWCAGENANGQIGFGLAGATNVLQWMQVRDSTTGTPITDATAIGAGWAHACAVRAGGALWCWGRNSNGQLGNNATTDAPAAVQVRKETDNMPLANIVEVGGGLDHSCARDSGGAVWCFGRNQHNQIGDATVMQRPRAVQTTTGVATLEVGRDTNCARKTGGDIWCWGRNNDGQVGDGTSANKATPVMVGMAKQIAVGTFAICRLNMDDTVSCSGNPWRYRVGNGLTNSDADVTMPAPVLAGRDQPPLANVAELALGGASCARLADGTVKCWSDNTHGATGVGAAAPFPATVRMRDGSPLGDAMRLKAHFSHLCAWRKTGEVVCWGRGLSGEWGDGRLEDRGAAARLEFPCP